MIWLRFKFFENFIPFTSIMRKYLLWVTQWHHSFRSFVLVRFLRRIVPQKSVLIVEPNPYHGEILPGYAKYWCDLGYNVELILRPELVYDAPFCRFDKTPKIFYMLPHQTKRALKIKAKSYDFVFLSTSVIATVQAGCYIKHLGFEPNGKHGFFMIEHTIAPHIKEMGHDKLGAPIFSISGFQNVPALSPHYFGDIKITSKSVKTSFAATVNISENRTLLFDSVRELLRRGHDNFRVIICGRTVAIKIPSDLKKYIVKTGKCSFDTLWKIWEQSDFMLPLLNPEPRAGQERYAGNCCTGSYNGILGFQKPAIIHSTFSKHYKLDETNSIIYDDNKKLPDAMVQAIMMNNANYAEMQSGLSKLAKSLEKESLDNLQAAIEKNCQK